MVERIKQRHYCVLVVPALVHSFNTQQNRPMEREGEKKNEKRTKTKKNHKHAFLARNSFAFAFVYTQIYTRYVYVWASERSCFLRLFGCIDERYELNTICERWSVQNIVWFFPTSLFVCLFIFHIFLLLLLFGLPTSFNINCIFWHECKKNGECKCFNVQQATATS